MKTDLSTPTQNENIIAGQAVYSKAFLSIYDLFVLGFSNRVLWRCPSKNLSKLYAEYASNNHLDIGVGTGYFLKKTYRNNPSARIGLLDLNKNCLIKTKEELNKHRGGGHIDIYHENLCEFKHSTTKPYSTIGLNYVLHCIPGDMESKLTTILNNLSEDVRSEFTVFGSTILGINGGGGHYWLSKMVLAAYNKARVFSNKEDTVEALVKCLNNYGECVQTEVIGSVCMFAVTIKPQNKT